MQENKLRTWLQNHRKLVRTGMVVAGFVLTVGVAQALFQVRINGVLVATDNGAGDTSPLLGHISLAPAAHAGWLVTVQSDLSKPLLNGDVGQLFVTTQATNLGGGGPILIEVTDTDYSVPSPSPPAWTLTSSASTTGLGAGAIVATDGVLNLANVPFAGGGVVLSHNFAGASPAFSGSDTKSVQLNGTVPYSLTIRTALGAPQGQTVAYSHTLTVSNVPEASSLAMLLPGLAPLGLVLRRRRKA